MLRELHIQNLAVIQDAAVEFGPGLNVFTGKTGAGKSLVLGALESLLGLRKSPPKMIRPGADQARISGVFELMDQMISDRVAAALDQELEPGDQVLITRKLFASGRSSLTVNGQPATAAMLRAAAEVLVDIHGQHDHQFLLRPSNQIAVLDRFAGCEALRQQFAELWQNMQHLLSQREELEASRTLRAQQLELYAFQADEIDAVDPVPGELVELEARERLLSNLRRIKQDADAAHSALYDSDGSISERLQALTHLLIDLADLDENLSPVAEQVRTATLTLQDAAFELSRYGNRLELDPEELGEVEQRLNLLNRLIQKYGGNGLDDDTLQPVLDYRDQIGAKIAELRNQSADQSQIDQTINRARGELTTIGGELSAMRRAAAEKIGPKVQKQLKQLDMAEATLRVCIESGGLDDAAAGPSGLDRVEMLARTNPGQDERPLREIASGGELSRVMLALKSVLSGGRQRQAAGGTVDVLVFDEIDANIGGRLGHVIGRKLRELASSKHDDRQVLCITHLPQIAAFADRHFHIVKQVRASGKKKHTRTTVRQLSADSRVNELAEMLAGTELTPTSKRQAKELLDAASA
ncbi:MAG: DNA repair protein RecN [Planctomycetota bacterium]